MIIFPAGSRPSSTANPDYFTGSVRMDPLIGAGQHPALRGISVTFEPGARTAWHTHPLGQTIIVTAGLGRAQKQGEPVQVIRPGDVVTFEPGEKHWHGAAPDCAMTHIALQEEQDGQTAQWMEQVSDADYGG